VHFYDWWSSSTCVMLGYYLRFSQNNKRTQRRTSSRPEFLAHSVELINVPQLSPKNLTSVLLPTLRVSRVLWARNADTQLRRPYRVRVIRPSITVSDLDIIHRWAELNVEATPLEMDSFLMWLFGFMRYASNCTYDMTWYDLISPAGRNSAKLYYAWKT